MAFLYNLINKFHLKRRYNNLYFLPYCSSLILHIYFLNPIHYYKIFVLNQLLLNFFLCLDLYNFLFFENHYKIIFDRLHNIILLYILFLSLIVLNFSTNKISLSVCVCMCVCVCVCACVCACLSVCLLHAYKQGGGKHHWCMQTTHACVRTDPV